MLTSHSDCAAEAAAADPEKRAQFPALRDLMDSRTQRIHEFLERPTIRAAIDRGELEVKYGRNDTDTHRLVVSDLETAFP